MRNRTLPENGGANRDEVLAEQVRGIFHVQSIGLLMSFLNSLVVTFVLREAVPHVRLMEWLAAIMLMIAVRAIILVHLRNIKIEPASARKWKRLAVAVLFFSGCIWGSSAFLIFPAEAMAYQVFLAFVLGGMAAGAAGTFSQLRLGYAAFSVPALVPIAIRFFLMPGEFHLAMGVMMVFFLAALWWAFIHSYRTNLDSLLLRFENRDVIENLTRAKSEMDELNQALSLEVEARRKAESELRVHQESLEAAVEERTTELKNIRDSLEAAVEQKEILLRELYHRTKNNMQVISSLISMQSASVSDERILQMFHDTGNRIRAMALVHEKLYQSTDLSSVNMKEYLGDLARALLESNVRGEGDIFLKLEADSFPLPIDVIMPCGLIVNELISNSLKYAFRGRGGEIGISFHHLGEGLMEIVYRDDGPGFQAGELKDIKTLGLKLVYNLATRQLGGDIRMVLLKGRGVEFRIRFKVP